ncbi:MAG: carboxylesterase family protein, partial [Pseudomonadota bacterium]|nr:carboxylesterase family protein [Pseudomonadota bacterium]
MVERAAARDSGAEPVLVVTIAYRVGAYGFLGGEALRARGEGSTGAFGLQDQRLALRWVRDNIGAFGGSAR